MAHLARGVIMKKAGELADPRPRQIKELCEIMARHTSEDKLCIIAGDFNIDIHHAADSPEGAPQSSEGYRQLQAGLRAANLGYIEDNLKDKESETWPPTYGYVAKGGAPPDAPRMPRGKSGWSAERLLTTKNQVPWVLQVTDDLILSNMPGAVVAPVSLAIPTAESTSRGPTHCSDHWGIGGTFPPSFRCASVCARRLLSVRCPAFLYIINDLYEYVVCTEGRTIIICDVTYYISIILFKYIRVHPVAVLLPERRHSVPPRIAISCRTATFSPR